MADCPVCTKRNVHVRRHTTLLPRSGEYVFSSGLLACAHDSVIGPDEVKLFHDHLVDVLLDAAAVGRIHIERDSISYSHEDRFVLIGTMNPD